MGSPIALATAASAPAVERRFRISLRLRLFALLLLLQAAALGLLVWHGWRQDVARTEASVAARLKDGRALLGVALADALSRPGTASAQRVANAAVDANVFDHISVKDSAGRVIASAGTADDASDDAYLAPFERSRAFGHLHALFPVVTDGRTLALVRARLNVRRDWDAIAVGVRENVNRAAGAMLFSVLLFLVVIQPLARRLGRMQAAAERMARGDYDVRIDDADVDEIGVLARGIDRMAGEVHGQVSRLSTALAELESMNAKQAVTAQHLRIEQSRLVALLSAMSFGVVFIDLRQAIVYSNPSFSDIWSLGAAPPLPGESLRHVLAEAQADVVYPEALLKRIDEMCTAREGDGSLEIRFRSGRIVRLLVSPVADDAGKRCGSLLMHEDVTQARIAEGRLEFLAERDPLTGLFNRRRFEAELEQRLENARRTGRAVSLFLLDLDEFKTVNDLFGHRMGDTVLLQVATAIHAQLRQGEFFARIGGDEFALLVEAEEPDRIRGLADRLMEMLGELSVTLGEVHVTMTASLGVATSPEHAATAQELVAQADAAMYQAKDAGKNTWRMYQPDHSATLRQRSLLAWNDRIRRALREGGFELFLQGVFGTVDRRRRYSEALLRMRDEATGQLLAPGEFVGYAEKSNLIVDIDRWVIGAAIDFLADCPGCPPLAVNISGRSFDDPTVAEFIVAKLQRANVEPSRLMLEITETAAIRDMREAQRFIERMHAAGCKLSLDDFGAGFASFAYIKQLPVDVLKIDGLFVRDIANSHDNQVLVKSMLDVARGFGKATVAEWVEDADSLQMLRALGVDMVQGYILERPQPAASALRAFSRERAALHGEELLEAYGLITAPSAGVAGAAGSRNSIARASSIGDGIRLEN